MWSAAQLSPYQGPNLIGKLLLASGRRGYRPYHRPTCWGATCWNAFPLSPTCAARVTEGVCLFVLPVEASTSAQFPTPSSVCCVNDVQGSSEYSGRDAFQDTNSTRGDGRRVYLRRSGRVGIVYAFSTVNRAPSSKTDLQKRYFACLPLTSLVVFARWNWFKSSWKRQPFWKARIWEKAASPIRRMLRTCKRWTAHD